MNKKYLDIEQLRKKRYHKNSNRYVFIKFLILIVLIIIMLALLWVFYGKLDVIIKTNGIIKYQNNISTVYSIKGGRLKDIVSDKKKIVNKGDLLFEIKKGDILKRKEFLKERIKTNKKYVDELKETKQYLLSNRFKIHERFELLKNEMKSFEEKANYYVKKIDKKEKELLKFKELKNVSITEIDYLAKKDNLNQLKFELKSLVNKKIVEIDNRIIEKRKLIDKDKLEIESINNDFKNYRIKAPIAGRIEFIKEYNIGDYIPAGKEVLKIIPSSQNKYIVELAVQNKDILRIKKDDLIRYRISSYPYKEYGVAEGKVLKIDRDATNMDNKNYVYKIKASINNYLTKGDKRKYVAYRNNMLTQASIVVDKRKIIYYILEKLDFLNTNL
ncbi:MAG: HlyD family efflux transporter periplasmic adaptor subunit [Bacillota bacterium]